MRVIYGPRESANTDQDWEQLKTSRNLKEVCGFLKKKTIYFELICCSKLSDVFLEVNMSWCLYWPARLRDRQVLKHPFWSDTCGTAAANDRRTGLVQTKSWYRRVFTERKFITVATWESSASQRSGTPGGSKDIDQPDPDNNNGVSMRKMMWNASGELS